MHASKWTSIFQKRAPCSFIYMRLLAAIIWLRSYGILASCDFGHPGAELPGRCREVSIRTKCMDRHTVGTKNPGHCGEVAVGGGSTLFGFVAIHHGNNVFYFSICVGWCEVVLDLPYVSVCFLKREFHCNWNQERTSQDKHILIFINASLLQYIL